MGLQEVIGEVESGGKRRAQEILDAAQAEADAILAAAKQKAAEYQTQRLAQADRDVAQLEAQAESHGEFEARKRVLEVEAELRQQLRRVLLEGFAALPAKTRQAHLKKLLATAKDVVPEGSVWGAAQDEKTLSADKAYKWAGAADIAGGLIAESKDGKLRVDLSYETLLQDRWRDILRSESGLFA